MTHPPSISLIAIYIFMCSTHFSFLIPFINIQKFIYSQSHMSDRDRSFQRPKKKEQPTRKLFLCGYLILFIQTHKNPFNWICFAFFFISSLSNLHGISFNAEAPETYQAQRESYILKKSEQIQLKCHKFIIFDFFFQLSINQLLASADNDNLVSKMKPKVAFIWKFLKVKDGN